MLTLLFGKTEQDYQDMTEEADIPPYMASGVFLYVEKRARPGDFLMAVLENNFVRALGHADQSNMACLSEWAIFLTWCLPANCWGSAEIVRRWLAEEG